MSFLELDTAEQLKAEVGNESGLGISGTLPNVSQPPPQELAHGWFGTYCPLSGALKMRWWGQLLGAPQDLLIQNLLCRPTLRGL